jgi:hypothetical protein
MQSHIFGWVEYFQDYTIIKIENRKIYSVQEK